MNSRERVQAALNHQTPDRVPVDLGGTLATSITSAAYGPLRDHLGLPPEERVVFEQTQQLPYLGEDLLVRLGVDTRVVALPRERAFTPVLVDDGESGPGLTRGARSCACPNVAASTTTGPDTPSPT